ncbi:MAG: hypothetical protein V1747_08455 [Candidatus Omnitrophota bacterium]
MKTDFRIILLVGLFGIVSGCSAMELRQEFLGIYTIGDIANAEKKYTHEFAAGSEAVFEKTLKILEVMQSEIIKKDIKRSLIVAQRFDRSFHSCIDTTEVCILVNPVNQGHSEVVVVSGNYSLAEFVSEKIFNELTKKR